MTLIEGGLFKGNPLFGGVFKGIPKRQPPFWRCPPKHGTLISLRKDPFREPKKKKRKAQPCHFGKLPSLPHNSNKISLHFFRSRETSALVSRSLGPDGQGAGPDAVNDAVHPRGDARELRRRVGLAPGLVGIGGVEGWRGCGGGGGGGLGGVKVKNGRVLMLARLFQI